MRPIFYGKELKMVKLILKIDGMKCAMCEVHVDNQIRKYFKVKKVKSSHQKGETIIISEEDIDTKLLHEVIDPTGYKILGIERINVVKKGLFYKEI